MENACVLHPLFSEAESVNVKASGQVSGNSFLDGDEVGSVSENSSCLGPQPRGEGVTVNGYSFAPYEEEANESENMRVTENRGWSCHVSEVENVNARQTTSTVSYAQAFLSEKQKQKESGALEGETWIWKVTSNKSKICL